MNAIKEAYNSLVKERDQLLYLHSDLASQRVILSKQIQDLEKKLREVSDKYEEKTQQKLSELNNQIAGLARMLPNHVKVPA